MFSCSKSNNNNSASAKDSVLYSNWTPLNMSLLGVDPNSGDSVFGQEITAKAITKAIMDRGLVLMYVQGLDPNGDSVIQNAEALMTAYTYVGAIDLISDFVDYSGFNFRYVVIPGKTLINGVRDGGQTLSISELKTLDYDAATRVFNLPPATFPSVRSGSLPLRQTPALRLRQ